MTNLAIRVFYSYSRQDREMRDRLDDHLAHLRRSGKICTWCDLELEPGSEWEKMLLEKLETADVILLLVSARFLASDYCSETELQRAIDRHNAGKAHVIPVILKPCDWNTSYVPFSKLQVLPNDAKPISSYRDEDEAYAIVAQGIRQVVERLLDERCKQKEAEVAAQKAEEEQQRQLEQQQREAELERSRRNYQQAFEQVIVQHHFPLNEIIRDELILLQAYLGLSNQDVAQIEAPIIARKQAEQEELERQRQAAERERLRQIEQEQQQQLEQLRRNYQQAFEQAIAQYGYPLYERIRQRLQVNSGLSDRDVARIEAPIIERKQAERKELERQQELRRERREAEQAKRREAEQVRLHREHQTFSQQGQTRRILWRHLPWRWLALSLLGYTVTGSMLSLAFAPFWAWAWAVTGALAVALAVAVAVAVTSAPFLVVAGVGAVIWAGAVAVAVAAAGEELLKSFSKMQTFLILAGVSLGGLELGWLVGDALRSIGIALSSLQ